MLVYLIVAFAGLVSNQAEFETDHVRIRVTIKSNIYTYEVTNLSESPIVHFEVKRYAAYNFIVPEGWQEESSSDIFRASTSNSQTAILSNETAEFSLRVSSAGAVLGTTPAKVQFQSGKTSTVPGVWAPVAEPRSYGALVAGLITAIVLLHTAFLVYRNRRRPKATTNGA